MYSKLYSNLFTLGEIATGPILYEAFLFSPAYWRRKKNTLLLSNSNPAHLDLVQSWWGLLGGFFEKRISFHFYKTGEISFIVKGIVSCLLGKR
jgi:hypothetical protein